MRDDPERTSRRRLAAGALILAAGLPVRVAAEPTLEPDALGELSLEELMDVRIGRVEGASRYEQKVTRAPASVTVVGAEEIRRLGHRTLADVLRGIAGIYVTYERNYSNLGMRGFGRPGDFNTRVLLLVDGHRMNDNLYGSALIGPEAILDVDLIERVEVIRGPSSSIYGSSAFLGVINVVTRKGARVADPEFGALAGTEQTYGGRASYGMARGARDLTVSASMTDSAGQKNLYYPEFDDPATANGIARDADAERAYSLFASAGWDAWRLAAAYSQRDKDIPTASFGTVFADGRERTVDTRWYLDLQHLAPLSQSARVLSRVYYDHYGYRADYPYDFAGPGDPPFVVVAHDDTYGDGAGAEIQLTHTLFGRHTVVLGAEHRRDLDLYQSNFTGDPRSYSFQDSRDGHSTGAYSQVELVLGSRWLVNAGLRYDYYHSFGGKLSPRLGVIFQPAAATSVKLLYGQAYRAPNAFELYQESPGFSRANPGLQPETIRTHEAVLEQYLGQHLNLGLSIYHYDMDDMISQGPGEDGRLVFENQSTVEGRGGELSMDAIYPSGLRLRASYALQETSDQDGRGLSNSPRRLGRAHLIAPLGADTLSAGVEVQYASHSASIAGNRIPGFVLANATLLRQKLWRGLDLSLGVYNLLDEDYAYPASTSHRQDSIPQDGRSYRLKATVQF